MLCEFNLYVDRSRGVRVPRYEAFEISTCMQGSAYIYRLRDLVRSCPVQLRSTQYNLLEFLHSPRLQVELIKYECIRYMYPYSSYPRQFCRRFRA